MTKVNIIDGIATSPTLTTHGDNVSPAGLRWSLPIPLLRNHDPNAKVGEVVAMWLDRDTLPSTDGSVRDSIIRFRAVVQNKDAWDDILSGDLPAVSILRQGFAGGGDILELSVCEEGANPDSIIKTIGVIEDHLAADRNASIKRFNFPVLNIIPKDTPEQAGARLMSENYAARTEDPFGWEVKGLKTPAFPKRLSEVSGNDLQSLREQRCAAGVDALRDYGRLTGIDPNAGTTQREFIEMTGQLLAEIDWCRELVGELRSRVDELDSDATVFRGGYQRAISYRRGSLVSYRGQLYAALKSADVGEAPGDPGAHKVWQLCVKRGDLDD